MAEIFGAGKKWYEDFQNIRTGTIITDQRNQRRYMKIVCNNLKFYTFNFMKGYVCEIETGHLIHINEICDLWDDQPFSDCFKWEA